MFDFLYKITKVKNGKKNNKKKQIQHKLWLWEYKVEHKKWNRVYVLKKLNHIIFIVTIFGTSYPVHLYELPPISTAEYIQDVPSGVGGDAIGGGSDGTGVTGR